MAGLNTRFRSLWVLALGLPLTAGIVAFVLEEALKSPRACTTGAPQHGLLFFIVFIALALLPGVVVGVAAWRSERSGEDTVGPFVVTMCLAVFLVFIGLLVGWHGTGCIT